jgi:glycosyltransferase involved in cell wall biosynthesis
VTWQATNEEEAKHIRALWGSQARISVAPNLPSRTSKDTPANRTPKHAGTLRLVFLSRISRMKNLNGALAMLGDITATVDFDIYGTQEDRQYWDECQQLIGKLPPNIRATYRGSVDPDDVIPTLAAYDALLLPTLGENFGHVILEALLAGCPALLSDQTPWRHLADSQAGFDIPLDDTSQFQRAIEYFAEMDDAAHAVWSSGARRFGLRYASNPELVGLTRAMLAEAKSPTGNN